MLLLTSALIPRDLGHCSGYMVLESTFVLRLLVWSIDQNNAQNYVGIAFTGQRTPTSNRVDRLWSISRRDSGQSF